MNYNGDIHFSFFFQADACYFLAQLISETTNPIKRGVGQDTSDKIEMNVTIIIHQYCYENGHDRS